MNRNHNYENRETQQRIPGDSTTRKLTYLLVGGSIGAAVALLFAPKAGQELRGDIADATRKGYDKTLETAQQLKGQSGTYYQQIKEQAGDVYKVAADKIRGGSQSMSNDLEKVGNKVLDTAKENKNQLADAVKQSATNIDDEPKFSQPLV